ncbi:hypothetical protein ACHWQZ_G014947 [Mnemiopsis leidyi]
MMLERFQSEPRQLNLKSMKLFCKAGNNKLTIIEESRQEMSPKMIQRKLRKLGLTPMPLEEQITSNIKYVSLRKQSANAIKINLEALTEALEAI